jgi:hypothetical protein
MMRLTSLVALLFCLRCRTTLGPSIANGAGVPAGVVVAARGKVDVFEGAGVLAGVVDDWPVFPSIGGVPDATSPPPLAGGCAGVSGAGSPEPPAGG